MIAQEGNDRPLIVITGAMGFIGSCQATRLSKMKDRDLVIVDDFSAIQKNKNIDGFNYKFKVERKDLFTWLNTITDHRIDFFLHIGARTDTTEMDIELFNELNLNYSKEVWKFCTNNKIPLIYASSAATYGDGKHGYSDDHRMINNLAPLNPYGESKNEFDKWVLLQKNSPPLWYGLKFFNVYGPNEYHKHRMASVIYHAFHQLKNTGQVKLFRSHKNEFKDGEQLRDFIYVVDVVNFITFLMKTKPYSGIYNLGTGTARTFYDLAKATADAMNIPLKIEWIDIPGDIRDKYQYFTEARIDKLRSAGYDEPFMPLENGIQDYVKNYLLPDKYL